MNAKDVLKHALNFNRGVLTAYLSDLSDADLLVRPAPKANHIAWQLGHLIAAEGAFFAAQLPGGKAVELPAGFAEQHARANSASDTGFKTKKEYLDLLEKVRANTLAALDRATDADFEKPITEGRLTRIAPTVGALFFLASNHDMMHAGQFAVVRRLLGKPVLF